MSLLFSCRMAGVWFSVCFLAVLSSEVLPGEGQTPSWKRQNLQGMMFSVMDGGSVRFLSDNPTNITGLTVCLRVLTEQQRYSIRLNYINQTEDVRLEVYKFNYDLYVNGSYVTFDKSFMVPAVQEHWPWKNRCFTWESSSGMAQLWSDGNMSLRKGVARGQVFSGLAELSFSGFVGQVFDVYVWDRPLNSQDVRRFLYYTQKVPFGIILDWCRIRYSTSGYTVLEPIFG